MIGQFFLNIKLYYVVDPGLKATAHDISCIMFLTSPKVPVLLGSLILRLAWKATA